jgi:hypothetical protein
VTSAVARIFERLSKLGFQVREGPIVPFDEELPLVEAVAWDQRTAQIALIVEYGPEQEQGAWQQLMFAAAGLRHHLASQKLGPAFGPPLILAVVEDEGAEALEAMAEDLNQRYAVFSRVDLNLVRNGVLEDDDRLDDALAPLLPRCRDALGKAISKDEVRRFWGVLREEIEVTAEELGDQFADFRVAAGRAAADALIGDLSEIPEHPPPAPVSSLSLKRFRSFEEAEVDLAPVTVIHGTNGSGKSALLEALEIGWAGTSQRKPSTVDAEEYRRHLRHQGEGEFEVVRDGAPPVTTIAERAGAELARCVLPQDVSARLAERSPDERYADLVQLTGLELPDVEGRTAALVRDAKQELDHALRGAALPPLATAGRDALKHLTEELKGGFVARLPVREDLLGLEDVLSSASGGAFQRQKHAGDEGALAAAEEADQLLAESSLAPGADTAPALDRAADAIAIAARSRRDSAQAVRLLVDSIRAAQLQGDDESEPGDQLIPAVPRGLAARWLGHRESLQEAARFFRAEAKRIEAPKWAERLRAYADSLDEAAAEVPRKELQDLAGSVASIPLVQPVEVPDECFEAAGFLRPVENPMAVLPSLTEYLDALQRQTAQLDAIEVRMRNHPARGFADHSERVIAAVCKFELARRLRRRKEVEKASEDVVADLLDGLLAPVVRELLGALVRFDWYFKPPIFSAEGGKLTIGGIGTKQPDLDARFILNAAERSVLGLAWFLALFLLQPEERQQVLVIDDAPAAFDSVNRAGFVSTLRAVVRLLRPRQVILASHDDAFAAWLTDELAPVDGWPSAAARVRCKRNTNNVSVTVPEDREEESRDLQPEIERLGLTGEAVRV